MKCLILAGGRGERLWPLSRKDFPKQFIRVQKNHSLFQETVARNIPYCDEFIIITNWEYKNIIANQMETFQGVPYRCVFEEEPRKTTAAITLTCMALQPSEFVFVVAADHLIGMEDCEGSYKDSILKAKENAAEGKIVLFGKRTAEIDSRFGYIVENQFIEKPDRKTIKEMKGRDILQNIGLMVFQNGSLLNEVKRHHSDIYKQCRAVFEKRKLIPEGTLYSTDALETIEPIAIEKSVLEATNRLFCLEIGFSWNDVGSLEDLEKTEYVADGVGVVNEGTNSIILNQSSYQVVVVNDLDNVLVVNTTDAVYIGRRGKSHLLKQILHDNPELNKYFEKGAVVYRPWGYYEQLFEEERYQVRRVVILPGRTIYEHKHEERTENWSIVEGTARVVLDGMIGDHSDPECIEVKVGAVHQISNIGNKPLILIETAIGKVLHDGNIVLDDKGRVTETDLGLQIDPLIKLSPAFMDYLWGGTKLRDVYGKKCDYDIIAESWELSAHPAGNSVVASGRHKGLSFSRYLETVGKKVLGWKCAPLQAFPLLIKFIDAKQNLSVQVHPDDDYALENENEYGKNEMWYVIDAEEGAGLYVGFNRNIEREEVERRVQDNTIIDVLNFYPTTPGDVFFIPAGTVHAIGEGNLICEIQQSSNTTYRLYDYGRVDKFGNFRELHLDKALDVLNYKKYEPVKLEEENGKVRCKYFEVQFIEIGGSEELEFEDDSFHAIVCIKGEGRIGIEDQILTIGKGETIFIPAANDTALIEGHMSLMIARI